MTKILKSLFLSAVVATVAVGASVAFFSDVEESKANFFVAGAVDLKVDHARQTYNGMDCKTCEVEIKSDTTNEVTGTVGGIDPGPWPHSAVLVTNINPAWTASIPGAQWIWWTDPTPEEEKGIDTTYTFEKEFTWLGPITGATLDLAAAADNGYEVRLNGNLIGSDPSEQNYNAAGQDTYTGFDSAIVQGTNVLEIKVKNQLRPAGQTWDNPGGLLYMLTIDGNCKDDYFKKQCRLWGEKDLAEGDKFWNFDDVKPGDFGSNLISLHVYDNDAYACMYAYNLDDEENDRIEPEVSAGDTSDGPHHGELSPYLKFFAWNDDGDGEWESGETSLTGGAVSGDAFLNSMQNLGQLAAGDTGYLGIAWCFGEMTVGEGTISCDGSQMSYNQAQTDSTSADVGFYVEQARHNKDFECPEVLPTEPSQTP